MLKKIADLLTAFAVGGFIGFGIGVSFNDKLTAVQPVVKALLAW